ncbi:UDP-glucose/GDP-mannose dehydrogenase family protein [Fictibacillus nanhaiensis]|uniref:UDP-glucose dehydrogenase family protein n=1 Tax=Fictibacillus nanhaiensis TaxID=742169 RepID=UPI001C94EDEF|nr:UDP-glucose/GDP-mannose dehydrogenase family protein [Fictibacillus nanhaiensis]MBY6037093.1 UDP-glucose/GDP-mannose dehydrogenase family protein [Fictibacillus nanhaiensis]
MKITVIGTGYVGLVSGVCFSDLGNEVICLDKAQNKIDMLNNGEVPIYEPGLKELIEKNVNLNRLSFSTDIPNGIKNAEVIIIAVGTPPLPSGEANLAFIEQVARDIASSINGYKIIMTKSTVPVGTNERIAEILSAGTDTEFDVVSVPEFLREGSAVLDTFNPDRIIIGAKKQKAAEMIAKLHEPLTKNIITTDIRSAEMIKYASNAFLATKISFINEIANICDKVGADVVKVAEGMGYDKRIGQAFLNAGIGYGGSCFPKDTDALIQIAGNAEYDFKLLKAVVEVNKKQRLNVIEKLEHSLGNLKGKTIGIWGLAFKPNTDDIRDAPAIEIIGDLIKAGANVRAYDPIAQINFQHEMKNYNDIIVYCEDALETAEGCHAVCLLTEWKEFTQINLNEVEKVMKLPVLVDGRNSYSDAQVEGTNFVYHCIGRPNFQKQKQLI